MNRLKELRKEKKLTQKELAVYLDTTERTVLNYVKEHEGFIAQKGIIYQVAKVEKNEK